MKVCIAGKNNIAVDICQYLENVYGKEFICVIPNQTDTGEDGFQRSLLRYARRNKIEVTCLETVYRWTDLIFLSLEFDRIVRPERFASGRLFNIHFSLLPAYKGMYTSALPILHGNVITGVTLHRIDCGIDTGDIIAQRKIRIESRDTARILYLKYIKEGTRLVMEYVDQLIRDEYSTYPQPAVNSFYYNKKTIDYSHLELKMHVTAWQLACQIKAFAFRDYQLPEYAGYKLAGYEICNTKSYQKPGSILENENSYLKIATVDYDIKLIKDRFEDLLLYSRTNELACLQSYEYLPWYIKEQNNRGWTLLMVAAYNHSKEVFKHLLSFGADIDAVNYKGTTVMMYAKEAALKYNDYEIIDILLERKIDVFCRDYAGKSVLDYLEGTDNNLLKHIVSRI